MQINKIDTYSRADYSRNHNVAKTPI